MHTYKVLGVGIKWGKKCLHEGFTHNSIKKTERKGDGGVKQTEHIWR